MGRPLKFRLHFNRINMQRKNANVWTVHTSKACHQIEKVKSYVKMDTVFSPDGRQPRAYLSGRAYVYVHDNTAYLVDDNSPEHMTDDEYFEAING